MTGILAGVRVLDLSRMLSGPYATMMMADHGADVIKIEDAGGDTSRANGPFRDDDPAREWAGYFVSLNRSKKSIVLDLKSETGKETLRRLVRTADVLVETFRPGVMERLGLSSAARGTGHGEVGKEGAGRGKGKHARRQRTEEEEEAL